MRYNCGANAENCFNRKKRLKFAALDVAMPRKIAFTDIDGFSELNGYCCFIEWKEPGAPLGYAQEKAFTNLTRLSPKIVVFVVAGDAEHMSVQSWKVIYEGAVDAEQYGDIDAFRDLLSSWGEFADNRQIERDKAAQRKVAA